MFKTFLVVLSLLSLTVATKEVTLYISGDIFQVVPNTAEAGDTMSILIEGTDAHTIIETASITATTPCPNCVLNENRPANGGTLNSKYPRSSAPEALVEKTYYFYDSVKDKHLAVMVGPATMPTPAPTSAPTPAPTPSPTAAPTTVPPTTTTTTTTTTTVVATTTEAPTTVASTTEPPSTAAATSTAAGSTPQVTAPTPTTPGATSSAGATPAPTTVAGTATTVANTGTTVANTGTTVANTGSTVVNTGSTVVNTGTTVAGATTTLGTATTLADTAPSTAGSTGPTTMPPTGDGLGVFGGLCGPAATCGDCAGVTDPNAQTLDPPCGWCDVIGSGLCLPSAMSINCEAPNTFVVAEANCPVENMCSQFATCDACAANGCVFCESNAIGRCLNAGAGAVCETDPNSRAFGGAYALCPGATAPPTTVTPAPTTGGLTSASADASSTAAGNGGTTSSGADAPAPSTNGSANNNGGNPTNSADAVESTPFTDSVPFYIIVAVAALCCILLLVGIICIVMRRGGSDDDEQYGTSMAQYANPEDDQPQRLEVEWIDDDASNTSSSSLSS